MSDVVVIGAGPNGLVAANILADHGWEVTVLEAQAVPGGGVRSSELIEPGFTNDHCSAFYPLSAASPALRSLRLEEYGLRWTHAPLVVAHPTRGDGCVVLSREIAETVRSFDASGAGDGEVWQELMEQWCRYRPSLINALLTPFPPVRSLLGAARRSGSIDELMELARLGVVPVRRLGEERFAGGGARRLLAGLALHADLLPESSLSGFFGWLLACLGQTVGFPVPEGGAGEITSALVRRLTARGGVVVCNTNATRVVVRNNRAVAVEVADGSVFEARGAVVADTDAVSLYTQLLDREVLPATFLNRVSRFRWDHATVKVDWTLDGPIPWATASAGRAGTVHVAEGVDELTCAASSLARGNVPRDPFLIVGQPHLADASRQPPGRATPWAYTHVPRAVRGDDGDGAITGAWDEHDVEVMTDRIERRIEVLAPGFRALIRGRHVYTPFTFETEDQNMSRGSLSLGTGELYQQLVFRPVPGLARSETPVRGLYLGSASAHPGGGVHGACGANAARAALVHDRVRRIRCHLLPSRAARTR